MKNLAKLWVLCLVVNSLNIYASAAKPLPFGGPEEEELIGSISPEPKVEVQEPKSESLTSTVGKAAAGLAGQALSSLSGTKKTSSSVLADTIKTSALAAAGVPPIPPINVNIDVTTKIQKCLTGDDIVKVNGEGNTIQQIRGDCKQALGATGDVAKFIVPSGRKVQVSQVTDFMLEADQLYDFKFPNGQSGALTSKIAWAPISNEFMENPVYRVVIYTTRSYSRDRWTERYSFLVKGDISDGIASARVHPDGNVELYIFDANGDIVSPRLNILNKRAAS